MPDLRNPAVIDLLLGLGFGALIGCLFARRVTRQFAQSSRAPGLVAGIAVVVMLLGAVPSLLCAYIVGGNMGLALNALAGNTAAGEFVAVALGICLMLAICLVLCSVVGSAVGAAAALLTQEARGSEPRRVGGAVTSTAAR